MAPWAVAGMRRRCSMPQVPIRVCSGLTVTLKVNPDLSGPEQFRGGVPHEATSENLWQ